MAKQKKPFKIKCPATILAIIHEPLNVDRAMVKFNRYVGPETTLYIETPGDRLQKYLKSKIHPSAYGYTPLVDTALKMGVKKFVGLDSRKIWNIRDTKSLDYSSTWHFYIVSPLRERHWVLKLRNAKKGDVVIMHPDHAWRIAPLLGIDRRKIVWLDKPTTWVSEAKKALHWRKLKKLKELRDIARKQRRQIAMEKREKQKRKKKKTKRGR